jgi:hypothetical protein
MIGNRSLFFFVTLFLIMVITISTAPVDHDEDEFATTVENIETTAIPDVVTNDLLFFDITAMPIDKSIQTNEGLLFHKEGVFPITPAADGPASFSNPMSHVTVPTFNNDM